MLEFHSHLLGSRDVTSIHLYSVQLVLFLMPCSGGLCLTLDKLQSYFFAGIEN